MTPGENAYKRKAYWLSKNISMSSGMGSSHNVYQSFTPFRSNQTLSKAFQWMLIERDLPQFALKISLKLTPQLHEERERREHVSTAGSPVICLMNVLFRLHPIATSSTRQLQVKEELQEVLKRLWEAVENLKKNSQRNRRRRELGRPKSLPLSPPPPHICTHTPSMLMMKKTPLPISLLHLCHDDPYLLPPWSTTPNLPLSCWMRVFKRFTPSYMVANLSIYPGYLFVWTTKQIDICWLFPSNEITTGKLLRVDPFSFLFSFPFLFCLFYFASTTYMTITMTSST